MIGGEYKLLSVVGVGGMATIFEASHVETGLQVAIKFLRPEHSLEQENISRFQLEAEAASAVGHESIISIYGSGATDEGVHYLVMELLTGSSLGEAIKADGSLEIANTVYICCQVLSALAAVHQTGVIHRDLKVDNIYLIRSVSGFPAVKIIDFGLSRITQAETFGKEDAELTRKGYTVGTPAYMSPEQASGVRDLDQRTDVYSVGIILYRCLTGRAPFEADTAQDLLVKVMMEAPRQVRELRPEVPPVLERLVDRALAKDRNDRYQSAEEMFDELFELADEEAKQHIAHPRGAAERTAFVKAVTVEQIEEYRARNSSANPPQSLPLRLSGENKSVLSTRNVVVLAVVGMLVFFSAIVTLLLLNPFG